MEFCEKVKSAAKDFDIAVKDISVTQLEDDDLYAYDVTLSGNEDAIEAFIDNNEEVDGYTLYDKSTDTRGNVVLTYAPTSDSNTYLGAIIAWCKKFGFKPMKDKNLVSPDDIKKEYEEYDTMDIVDDFTKSRLYHLSFGGSSYRITPLCKALENSRFMGDTIEEFKEDLEEAGFDADSIELI